MTLNTKAGIRRLPGICAARWRGVPHHRDVGAGRVVERVAVEPADLDALIPGHLGQDVLPGPVTSVRAKSTEREPNSKRSNGRFSVDQPGQISPATCNSGEIHTGLPASPRTENSGISSRESAFSIYTSGLGNPTVRFHSRAAGPKALPVSVGAHTHAGWAFDTATTYTVTSRVTGTLAGTMTVKSSGHVSFTFQVLPSRSPRPPP
jgi:surface-anchored protein